MSGCDPAPPNVFLSYSHDSPEHMDRVLALSDRLRAGGIDCILDQYEPSPPEGWPRWMDKQIGQADFVLMVCTETYRRRVMGEQQPGTGRGVRWEGHLIYQHIYNADTTNTRFIPLLLESGTPEHIPTPLQGATHYPVDAEGGYEALYRRVTGQPAVQKPPLGKLRSLPPKNRRQDFFAPPFNVPERNPFFTGREETLSNLRRRLLEDSAAAVSQPLAVCGLGGIGKTQIAIEYAHRYRQEYQAVFWVPADSRLALTRGFVEIAGLLNLPQQDAEDQSLAVEAVKRWLRESDQWLLIFDNADQPELLSPFRPGDAKGHVLLSSRAQVFDLLGITRPVEIEELPADEALDFLLKRTGREGSDRAEREAAVQLVDELGRLPLALEQAGGFVLAKQCRWQDYLGGYRRRRLRLLEEALPRAGDYPESVATTWRLNFEQVRQASEASADVLRVLAFLSPDEIPLELFIEGGCQLGPTISAALAQVAEEPLLVDRLLEPLTEYSLIRRHVDARALSIHRLVQEVLKDQMQPEARRPWAERVVRAVNRAFPGTDFRNWPRCERVLPQARAAAMLIQHWDLASEEAGRLLNQVALYLYDRAQYAEAEPLSERALAIREKALGPDHPDVSTTLNNLAVLYKGQGKYAEAEPLYQRALAITEKALGPDHPSVATRLNNLAGLYYAQGKYAEAEPLFERDLAITEKALGSDHPEVATTLNNLALLYRAQGKYAEAEPLFERDLAITEKALGSDHPEVATTLNNLALLYEDEGKYAEAEPLYQRALAIKEKALGPDHPDVATTLNNLAVLYKAQGKYAEAEPLYQRALAITENALGPHHPDVATTLENYAVLLRKTQREAEAAELELRAKAIRQAAR